MHQTQLRGLPYDSCLQREDTDDSTYTVVLARANGHVRFSRTNTSRRCATQPSTPEGTSVWCWNEIRRSQLGSTVEPLYYGPLNYGHLRYTDGWQRSRTHAQCCDTNLTPSYGHLRIPYYGHNPWPQTDVTNINSTPYYGQHDVTASSEYSYK